MNCDHKTRADDKPVSGAYAEQLDAGFAALRFGPGLEAEYRQAHLEQSRRFVALGLLTGVCGTAALAVYGGGFGQTLWSSLPFAAVTPLVFAAGLVTLLVAAAVAPIYRRAWLLLAPAVLCVLGTLGAVSAAYVVTSGNLHAFALVLFALPVLYACSGLLVRQLSVVWLVVAATYLVALSLFGAASSVLKFEAVLIVAITTIGLLARYGAELNHRRAYLQRQVLLEFGCRDPLTGLHDRHSFDKAFARIWRQALRESKQIGLIILNIDGFTHYNQAHGHEAGNRWLVRIAAILDRHERRALDVAARIGGGEYALLLHGTTPEHLERVAKQILGGLRESSTSDARNGKREPITASIGAASQLPDEFGSPEGLKLVAQAALQSVRRAGGDGVEIRSAGPKDATGKAFAPARLRESIERRPALH